MRKQVNAPCFIVAPTRSDSRALSHSPQLVCYDCQFHSAVFKAVEL